MVLYTYMQGVTPGYYKLQGFICGYCVEAATGNRRSETLWYLIASVTAVGEEGEPRGTVLFVPLRIVIPIKPWVASKVLTAVLCCVVLGMLQIRKILFHFLQSRDRTWKQKWNVLAVFCMEPYVKVTLKVKFTAEQATKAQRGSRCIALLFLQPRR